MADPLARRVGHVLRRVPWAELLVAVAALGGWALLTWAIATLTAWQAWPISGGCLLLSLVGWKLVGTVVVHGLYVLSRSEAQPRSARVTRARRVERAGGTHA